MTIARPLPIAGLISIFFRTPKLLNRHPETHRNLRSIRPESVVQLHTSYPGRYNEVFGNRREIKIETQQSLTQSGNSQQCCGKEEVLNSSCECNPNLAVQLRILTATYREKVRNINHLDFHTLVMHGNPLHMDDKKTYLGSRDGWVGNAVIILLAFPVSTLPL